MLKSLVNLSNNINMANTVKFGIPQILHPTPETAKVVFRIVLYVAAVANFAVLTFSDIPQEIKSVVGQYSVEIVAFVHGITRMFGLHVEDVPAAKESGE
jgi:hypothetical protein